MEFSNDFLNRETKNYLNNFGKCIIILWLLGILCVWLNRIELVLCFILAASIISVIWLLLYCVHIVTRYDYPNSDEILRIVGNDDE